MKFTVTFVGSCDLSTENIWPDGGRPENPTPADVVEVMKTIGDRVDLILRAFGFDDDITVTVSDGKTSSVW